MTNSRRDPEEILKEYLISLNPKHTHTLPKEHIFRIMKGRIDLDNLEKLKSIVAKNKPVELIISVI